MNIDTVEGKWKQFIGKVKATWGKLTDDEITRAEGNAERLAGFVQERYGITKDAAEEQVRKFVDKHPEWRE